jgi:hypothetical protein
MKRIWLVVVFVIFGALFAIGKLGSRGAAVFELRTKTEIVQGIRATPYTDYWFQEVRGISRTTLWHTRRMEKFKQHWISPTGVVWIETDRFTGPGGSDKIWAGDRSGVIPVANFPPSQQRSPTTISGLAETFRNGFGELLSLNKGLADERMFLLVRKAGTPTLAFETTTSASHPRFLLAETLRDPDLAEPTIRPIEEIRNAFLVVAKSKSPSRPGSTLIISGRSFARNNEPASITSLEERTLTGVPDQILLTPSGYLAYLMFDSDIANGGAWFEVGEGAKLLYKADLMRLGDYHSVTEARKDILPKVSWKAPEGWQELPHKFPNNYARDLDKFDFFDTNGKRFEVVVNSKNYIFDSGSANVESGLVARRKIIEPFQSKDITWMKKDDSPNGIFHVKAEGTNWGNGQTYVSILLTATVSDHGKPVEVQLFSKAAYGEVWPRVTNSGRVFLMNLGKTNTETKRDADLAMISIGGVPPLGAGGIGLLSPDSASFGVAPYRTNAEVKKGILWDKMKIVSRGKKTTHQFLGVDLPLWEVEEFWIPQANGTTIHQAIVNGNFAWTKIVDGKQKLMIP